MIKKIFLASYFLFLSFSCLFAEEEPTFNLGEIVVTKDDWVLREAPSVTEVTFQDIEIKNAQSVDEALDFIPGVRVTVGQKNEPYAAVRGFCCSQSAG